MSLPMGLGELVPGDMGTEEAAVSLFSQGGRGLERPTLVLHNRLLSGGVRINVVANKAWRFGATQRSQ